MNVTWTNIYIRVYLSLITHLNLLVCELPVQSVELLDDEEHAEHVDQDPEHVEDVVSVRAL